MDHMPVDPGDHHYNFSIHAGPCCMEVLAQLMMPVKFTCSLQHSTFMIRRAETKFEQAFPALNPTKMQWLLSKQCS